MESKFWLRMSRGLAGVILAAAALLAPGARAASFGTAVPTGGQAPDIALDGPRGVVYVANFAANRIDVVSLANHKPRNSISVGPYPGWLAFSLNRHFLLIAHCGNFKAPSSSVNALALLDVVSGGKQTFSARTPPFCAGYAPTSKVPM
jgi:DNA-binding beta-propeller fold protein YncE